MKTFSEQAEIKLITSDSNVYNVPQDFHKHLLENVLCNHNTLKCITVPTKYKKCFLNSKLVY